MSSVTIGETARNLGEILKREEKIRILLKSKKSDKAKKAEIERLNYECLELENELNSIW